MSDRAPPLPESAIWLNTSRPLTPADLVGKLVLLHFWTLGCVNCLHTLPVLARLEEAYGDHGVLVIGIHSPNFPGERDPDAVRAAVERYAIGHPVVVDSDHEIRDEYVVRSWPTLVLVGPDGRIIDRSSGEPEPRKLFPRIESLLAEHGPALSGHTLPIDLPTPAPGALAYPSKILVHGDRLYVADTGHHQIVEFAVDGVELRRFGTGRRGMLNGADAEFSSPRGLAVANKTLYVADTGNHLIRSIELSTGVVERIAGTGRRGRTLGRPEARPPGATDLRSPWDLAIHGDVIYVAMAGSHQIWRLWPGEAIGPWAGTGREARLDGTAATAAFAQPSALALSGDSLLVADPESSSIRSIDLADQPRHVVDTLVDGDEGPLQHPQGLAFDNGELLIADTFNHSIRRLDPSTGEITGVFGNGYAHRLPETDGLADPEDVAVVDGRVLVADTSNHRIMEVTSGELRRFGEG